MTRKKKSFLILGVLIAIVGMGIGYASISGISLLINGTSTVKSRGEMSVRFVKNIASETAIDNPIENAIRIVAKNADNTDMDMSDIDASIDTDVTANFSVGTLSEVGSYVDFTYTVVNESNGVDAMLSFDVDTENDASDYFEVTKRVDKVLIGEGEVAKVTIKVKLKSAPRITDVDANFTVTLNATAYEEESVAGDITGTTQRVSNASNLAKAIQNDNIKTIIFDNDITVENKADLVIDSDTTIDFNGHTLNVKPSSFRVENGAELVLDDTSGIGGVSASKDAITVMDGSELVIENGTYETTEFTGRGSVITIPTGADNAKITINDGNINGEYFAVSVYGNSELEINGGNLKSTASVNKKDSNNTSYYAYAVRLSNGHVTMNGGTIEGVHGGLGLIGTATGTINSGSITLNNSYAGAKDSYYILYMEGNASCDVYDGTFTNNGTNPIVYSSSTGFTNLRGGVWTGTNTKAFNGTPNAGRDSIKVYGGTYKKNTSGTLTDYDVSAYAAS